MSKKILYGIIAIIIVAGIVMFFVNGFNVGNVYGSYTKIGFYNENGVNRDEVAQIVSEVFEGKEATLQDVEYFGEMVLITLPTVTDEQIDNFVAKINEKYELEYDRDDLDILTMPGLTFKEVVSPYVLPLAISIVVSAVYIGIRYRLLGMWKMIGKTILAVILVQAVLVSIYLILNLPLDISIVPAVLIALGIAFLYVTNDNNHLLETKKAEAEA